MTTQASSFDVVVIGAGVAGASLALSLAARGKKVGVIATSPGASGVSSGSWDFGPIAPGASASLEQCAASPTWREAYTNVLVDWKKTPDGGELAEATQNFQRELAPDLEIDFRFDRPWHLPTTGGAFKSTFGAQAVQAASDLSQLENRRVAILYSRSWRYRADLLAKAWTESAKRIGKSLQLVPTEVPYEKIGTADSPLPHVSARFRDDREELSRFLETAAKATAGFDVALLPPLSLEDGFARSLREAFKVPVAECLATTEPNAGHRLHQAIRSAFSRNEIEWISSSQIHSTHSEGWLRELSVFTGQGWRALRATQFVLATGKFFGGGLTAEWNSTREAIFDLPLFVNREAPAVSGRPGSDWARTGVWVDEQFRPQTRPAISAFHNLRACGSILGGVDFSAYGMGLGFMAFTGYRSGSLLT